MLLLLGKRTCCVGHAFYGGDSLYQGLVGDPWSLITLYELERLPWSLYGEVRTASEVQVVEG